MDQSQKLGEAKISSLVLQFSIPAIVVLLMSAIYNVIDRIFIGNSLGSLGIAGVTIAFPVMMVIAALSTLIGVGGAAILSIKLGEGKKDVAEQVVGNVLLLLIVISVIITIVGLVFLTPILQAYGASNEIMPYARDYLAIILIGTLFNLLSSGMNSLIRAEGNPQKAMMTLMIGPVLNVILAPIFIFGFHWGMIGAALATDLAQLASAIWVLSHFFLGRSSVKFSFKNLKPVWPIIGTIFALGAAPCFVPLSASILNVIINTNLLKYGGDIAVSGMGVVVSLQILCIIPLLGISQGIQPIIGFNYGAQKLGRVKSTLIFALLFSLAFTIPLFLLTQLLPAQIVALFNSRDKAMIDFGANAMRIYLFGLPIIGVQSIGSGFFQAMGKAKQALIVTLVRPIVIFIPLLLILPNYLGLNGVLFSGPITDFTTFLLTGTWLLIEVRQLNKIRVQPTEEQVVSARS